MSSVPALEVPDYIEPMLGWRVWHVEERGITSITRAIYWPERKPLEAQCYKADLLVDQINLGIGNHNAPHEDCTCGIYATSDIHKVDRIITQHNRARYRGKYRLLGIAALWGKVIEHREGWRAQYALPQLFCLVPPHRAAEFGYDYPTTHAHEHWTRERAGMASSIERSFGVRTIIAPSRGGYLDQNNFSSMIAELSMLPLKDNREISLAAKVMEVFGSKKPGPPQGEHHCPICDDSMFFSRNSSDWAYSWQWTDWKIQGVIKTSDG